MEHPQRSWNQHDDEPCDLDLENVVGMLQQVQASAPTDGAPESDAGASAAPSASQGEHAGRDGWNGFNSWLQNQRVAPVPMQPLAASGSPGLPLGARTPVSRGAGGAVTPPAHRDEPGWESTFASMATPPRPTNARPSRDGSWVALPSDYAVAPTTVSSRTGPRTPPTRESVSTQHFAMSAGSRGTDVWSSERRPAAMAGSAVRSGAPLLYSINSPPNKDTSSSSAGSPPNGGADAFPQTQRPLPQTPNRFSNGLSTQAAPFTPKRSGADVESPHPTSHTTMTPMAMRTPPRGAFHAHAEAASLTPLATPADWCDPAHGATPQPSGGHAVPYGHDLARAHPIVAAKDQLGCRTLQRLFDMPWPSPDVQETYAQLFPALPELMADAYGNFLVQKLLDVAPDAARLDMTQLVAPHLPSIAVTPHGTFAAQKLVDSLRGPEERIAVCSGLASSIVPLCTDANGAHVVQKVIAAVGVRDRLPLVRGIADNVTAIGNNRYGTCIVQRCLERTIASPAQFNMLAEAIVAQCTTLVLNPFGNYVVQRLVDQCASCSPAVDAVVRTLTEASARVDHANGQPLLRTLVVSQFSSKAVEKSLQRASAQVAASFAQEVGRPEVMSAAIGDQFGNYIVQTSLAIATTTYNAAAVPHTAPSSRPVPPLQQQPVAATAPRDESPGSLTVTAGGELTEEDSQPQLASMAMSAPAANASPDDEAAALAAFSAFVQSVGEHIGLVRGCGFQKKMEHRLEQANRARRAALAAASGAPASPAHQVATAANAQHQHGDPLASPPRAHARASAGPATPSSHPPTPAAQRRSTPSGEPSARGRGRGSPQPRNGRRGGSTGVSPVPDRESPAPEPTQRRRPPHKASH